MAVIAPFIDVTRPATTYAARFHNRVAVKIVACGNPHWWYRDMVGQTVETVGLVNEAALGLHYGVLDNVGEVSRFILPEDAREV